MQAHELDLPNWTLLPEALKQMDQVPQPITPACCLERISCLQCKKKEPAQSLTDSLSWRDGVKNLKNWERVTWLDFKVPERRDLDRERSQEICRGSSLSFQQRTDQYIRVKKLARARERAFPKDYTSCRGGFLFSMELHWKSITESYLQNTCIFGN